MKKYIEVQGQEFKVEVTYSLGGPNHISGGEDKHGYTLTVIPVIREKRNGYVVERAKSYTGYKKFLLEVSRKSKKAEEEAVKMAEKYELDFIDLILENQKDVS